MLPSALSRAARAALLTALVLGLPLVVGSATAAAADPPVAQLITGLHRLDGTLRSNPSLTASQRAAVHRDKADLITVAYGASVRGVTFATVASSLDCVGRELQRARSTRSTTAARSRIAAALRCQATLGEALRAGGPVPAALKRDLTALGTKIRGVATRQRQGRTFGTASTAVRRAALALVTRHFPQTAAGGVRFPVAYEALECIDVKVEAGSLRGAAACARGLERALRALNGSGKDPITFGSDLTGTPVALPGVWEEDSEFWTPELTVPVAGTVTAFRLKVGSTPIFLPLRFSVVRPQPNGQVKVITTTNPVYPLPAQTPQTVTFRTSGLSFDCCVVQKGDIVTVDNSGVQAPAPYVWFAARPGSTTFSHMVRGVSQDAGQLWTPAAHPDLEVLLQVVMQPA